MAKTQVLKEMQEHPYIRLGFVDIRPVAKFVPNHIDDRILYQERRIAGMRSVTGLDMRGYGLNHSQKANAGYFRGHHHLLKTTNSTGWRVA